jgi:hypothetical protein
VNILFPEEPKTGRPVPKAARGKIRTVLRKLMPLLGLGDWEVRVVLTSAPGALARMAVEPTSHHISIELTGERIWDVDTLRADLAHELYHVHDAALDDAISRVRNKRDREHLRRAYEEAHDAQTRVLVRLVYG